MFIYFDRGEREYTSRGGAERERERESLLSRFRTVGTEPNAGLNPVNRVIVT